MDWTKSMLQKLFRFCRIGFYYLLLPSTTNDALSSNSNSHEQPHLQQQQPSSPIRLPKPRTLLPSLCTFANNNIHIRPMEPQDTEHVARIWRAGLDQTVDALCTGIFVVFRPLAEYLTEWAAQVALSQHGDIGPHGVNLLERWSGNSDGDRCMFVAIVVSPQLSPDHNISDHHNQEVVVGCVGVKRGMGEHHADDPSSSWASLWRMSVDAEYRRCGIGTRLVAAAEDWARSKLQCDSMILITINPLAANFYLQQGFRPARFRIFHYVKKLKVLDDDKNN